jgi:hypothetical protein
MPVARGFNPWWRDQAIRRGATFASIPQIFFLVFDFVQFQQRAKFFLEGGLAMMLGLMLDVGCYRR